MKTLLTTVLLISFWMLGFAQADKIVGKWKTIDDKDGSEKSIVNIFKATNGKYYGKIEKLFRVCLKTSNRLLVNIISLFLCN